MLGAAAASGDSSLWTLTLASLLAMLTVSVPKAWQYVLERQRHRYAERMERQRQQYAERMTEKIPPGADVELGDGPSSVRIRGGRAAAGEPGSPAPANVFPLSARRQGKLSKDAWIPPA
jgi:hypothetical protein